MSKKSDCAAALLFSVYLALFFALNLFLPDKTFSEKENRYLQTFPSFSLSSLLRGEFMPKAESWCADQFFARDGWISLKARLELLQGKQENNGIFLCRDERLIKPTVVPETQQLDRQIEHINAFADSVDIPVTLGLIPSSAQIYADLLPEGVRNDDQRAAIDYVYSHTHTKNADILSVLSEYSGEYIFYRTDHHWTSLGAFRACAALADALGSVRPSEIREKTVSGGFLGTSYSSSGFFWVRPDQIQTLTDEPAGVQVERYEGSVPEQGSLYAPEMLETKDKYRFFLGGNTPRAVIRTGHDELPSLLIIRDSFADSLVPFLLEDFSEIHLLDLRYFRDPVAEYAEANGIDSILILYSTDDFFTDSSLALLTR